MKNFKNYIYILAAISALAACRPQIVTPTPSKGSADFSRYIAIGNSLTAGYSDGGLYRSGQQNSYPSIIAQQMLSVGGGVFNQPLFTTDQSNGSGYLKLTGFDASGNPVIVPVTTNLGIRGSINVPGFGPVTLYTKYTDDIENYGVPGIKLVHLTYAPYGNLNGFLERLLPGASPTNTTTYLSLITAKPFTFFSNWLGNNDALGYATGGGGGYVGADALTDKATFSQLYSLLISSLTATGQKGIVATIPDVTTIPYFTTVTPAALLAGVKAQNSAVTALYVNAATNTSATTYSARPLTNSDLVTLSFPTLLLGKPTIDPGTGAVTNPYPYGVHPLNPIESKYVLDPLETALVKDFVSYYNSTIKGVAAQKGLAVFDAFTFLTNIKTSGLVVDGLSLNSNFISGGIFSLDGVHLTPRGYAIVANEFIKSINSQYGSTIPVANVAAYNGIIFP